MFEIVQNLTVFSCTAEKICKYSFDKLYKYGSELQSEDSPFGSILNLYATILYSKTSGHAITSDDKEKFGMLSKSLLSLETKMNDGDLDFCIEWKMKFIDILVGDVLITEEYKLLKAKYLILKARAFRDSKLDGLNHCIVGLLDAVHLLRSSVSLKNTEAIDIQIAFTYILIAECLQEAYHNFEEVLKYIGDALTILERTSNIGQYDCMVQTFSRNDRVRLLCNMVDLFSIKGYWDHQSKMCSHIFRLLECCKIPVGRRLAIFWSERRLSHSLCFSPISENFIQIMVQHLSDKVNSFDFWKKSFEADYPSHLSFFQKFSPSDSISLKLKEESSSSFFDNITVDKVENVILEIRKSGQSKSIYGHLCHDLAERLFFMGQAIKALPHALEAEQFRRRMLYEKFKLSTDIKLVEDLARSKLDFGIRRSVASELWPTGKESTCIDTCIDTCITTPWSVLRSYLESCCQVGTILEALGNGLEAKMYYQIGNKISTKQKFPVFQILFTYLIGQLQGKEHKWSLSQEKLLDAKNLLAKYNSYISCKSCRLALEASIETHCGDLYRDYFEILGSELRSPLDSYKKALQILESNESTTLHEIHNADKPVGTVKHRKCNICSLIEDHAEQVDINDAVLEGKKGYLLSRCWKCFIIQVLVDGKLKNITYLKSEYNHHKLRIQLHLKIANYKESYPSGDTEHEIHDMYLNCASMLLMRQANCCHHNKFKADCLNVLIQDNGLIDTFLMEKLQYFSNMSFLILKEFPWRDPRSKRSKCCELSTFQIDEVASWLLHYLIQSGRLPLFFQKVSRLIACVLLISTIHDKSLGSFFEISSLSISHWAAYFHQASIGNYMACQHVSLYHTYLKSSQDHVAAKLDTVMEESFRFAPEKVRELEEFVHAFYKSLPSVPVICLSVLEDDFENIIKVASSPTSTLPFWIMLSRFDGAKNPISMLLPVNHIPEKAMPLKSPEWKCPWSPSVVDNVAPVFKQLLEANANQFKNVGSFENWRSRRQEVHGFLEEFLKSMEDSWLGPWVCLMLGNRFDIDRLSWTVTKLKKMLRQCCTFEFSDNLISAVLNGSNSSCDAEACIADLILYRGHFGDPCKKKGIWASSTSLEEIPEKIWHQILKTLENKIDKGEQQPHRQPIILVLDSDVQMLPWESIPTLTNQEVYRMPSVSSIFFTLRRFHHKYASSMTHPEFPRVSPVNAYFLLNPDGDLPLSESFIGQWFAKHDFTQGEEGKAPAAKDLILALKEYEIFFYNGHGNGLKYMGEQEVRKLAKCAAASLMGCSSCSLKYKGDYFAPQGAPISYIFAGAPFVIGALWTVRNGDVNEFSLTMLDSWVKEETCSCPRTKRTKLVGCKKCTKTILSSMSEARSICSKLNGASMVCYGVPTYLV